jgi:hypothetical protein
VAWDGVQVAQKDADTITRLLRFLEAGYSTKTSPQDREAISTTTWRPKRATIIQHMDVRSMLRYAAAATLIASSLAANGANVAGTVKDAAGKPIENARIDHTGKLVVVGPPDLKASAGEIRTGSEIRNSAYLCRPSARSLSSAGSAPRSQHGATSRTSNGAEQIGQLLSLM